MVSFGTKFMMNRRTPMSAKKTWSHCSAVLEGIFGTIYLNRCLRGDWPPPSQTGFCWGLMLFFHQIHQDKQKKPSNRQKNDKMWPHGDKTWRNGTKIGFFTKVAGKKLSKADTLFWFYFVQTHLLRGVTERKSAFLYSEATKGLYSPDTLRIQTLQLPTVDSVIQECS